MRPAWAVVYFVLPRRVLLARHAKKNSAKPML